jgi:biotin operon repressor
MAIYHCSIKLIKRSQGRSVVAAAAYRSGQKLTNEWEVSRTIIRKKAA